MRHRIAAALLLAAPLLAAHADGPHYVAEIPFQSCAGLICLQATIDGTRRQTLALDTGNIHSALSWTKAQALGWTLEPYRGRDGKPVAGMAFSGPHMVQLGAVAIPSRMLVFQEDPPPARPDPYDGTLAFTDLKDRVLQIDYVHHLLRISEVLTDSGTSPLPGTLKTITFGNKGPAILTGGPFSVNGYTVQAQIDTCYTGTLLIYDAAATKLGLGAPAGNGRPRAIDRLRRPQLQAGPADPVSADARRAPARWPVRGHCGQRAVPELGGDPRPASHDV